jgi:hypothetical protein
MESPAQDTPTIYVTTSQESYKLDGWWHREDIYRAALWTTETWDDDHEPVDTYRTERRSQRELDKAIRYLKGEAAKLGYKRVHIMEDFMMGTPYSWTERIITRAVAA